VLGRASRVSLPFSGDLTPSSPKVMCNQIRASDGGIGRVGPLGRKGIENGRMDHLGAAPRLPGRRPSLEERLGLRPACGSACVPGSPRTPSDPSARVLSDGGPWGFCRPCISGVPRSVRPEGASVRPAKGNALVAEDIHRVAPSSPPSFGPTGQPFSCATLNGRRQPANTMTLANTRCVPVSTPPDRYTIP
jgi:hypothetical protein